MKIKYSQNGEITLSFVNMAKSCPSHELLMSQICLLMLFVKIKFSLKFLNLLYYHLVFSQKLTFGKLLTGPEFSLLAISCCI